MVIVEVNIGLIPSNITPITQVIMVDYCIYLLLLDVFMKVFMEMKEMILVVIMEDMDLGLKIPANITFTIIEKVLVVTVEVDIGLILDPFPIINQVRLVNCRVFMFMVMREL